MFSPSPANTLATPDLDRFRPYINCLTDELHAHVALNWTNRARLSLILKELRYRHSDNARRLTRSVEARITELRC